MALLTRELNKNSIAKDKQLGQLRPANTTAVSIYSAPTRLINAIVKSIFISNTTPDTALFRLFYDEDGTTFDETTSLFWDIEILKNETLVLGQEDFIGINLNTGNLGVRTSIANALTFTVFGIEVTAES
ncbi:MAG: hypothetical protein O6940_05880 [Ignavibacteria bacterium]|nr:hypothetical protein [Ignavibacteria bacterium]